MEKDFFSSAKSVSRTNENSEPFFSKGKKEEPFFKAAADSENAFFKPSRLTPPQFNATTNPVQKKQQKEGKLPEEIQMKMENSFGTDFSNVNIHKDSEKATDIGALAYTQGNNIHFAPGQFKPNTQEGQELIGHELTHVVQQNQGRVVPTTQAKGMPLNDDISLENEADEMGKKAAQSKLGQAQFDKNVSELNKQNNYAPLQMKEDIIQKDGGTTTAVAALAYQITSEVLSSAGGGSDIDLTVDEMTGMYYSRNATERSGGPGTNITTQKSHVFSYLLESVLFRENLIDLTIRMDYEVDTYGVGNISFAIEEIDDAAGWGGRFTFNLTPMESSGFGAVRLTVSFDTSGLGTSASGSFTYKIYPFGVYMLREAGDTDDTFGMQDSHSNA